MKTFKDFLEWYNNLDVIPFVEAIEKMKVFHKNKHLDLFRDGVMLLRCHLYGPNVSSLTIRALTGRH